MILYIPFELGILVEGRAAVAESCAYQTRSDTFANPCASLYTATVNEFVAYLLCLR